MPITQKDIKDQLCELVSPSDIEKIQTLMSLALRGWGYNNKLYKELKELKNKIKQKVKEVRADRFSHRIIARLDLNTLVLTDIKCKECFDKGWRLQEKTLEYVTCDHCNINKKPLHNDE